MSTKCRSCQVSVRAPLLHGPLSPRAPDTCQRSLRPVGAFFISLPDFISCFDWRATIAAALAASPLSHPKKIWLRRAESAADPEGRIHRVDPKFAS